MATHSIILVWRIPWTEKPGRLQFKGSQRVRHDCVTKHTHLWRLNLVTFSTALGTCSGWSEALCVAGNLVGQVFR